MGCRGLCGARGPGLPGWSSQPSRCAAGGPDPGPAALPVGSEEDEAQCGRVGRGPWGWRLSPASWPQKESAGHAGSSLGTAVPQLLTALGPGQAEQCCWRGPPVTLGVFWVHVCYPLYCLLTFCLSCLCTCLRPRSRPKNDHLFFSCCMSFWCCA